MSELEEFKIALLAKHKGRFEYCEGYKTMGSNVAIKCNNCNSVFAAIARKVLGDNFKGCFRCLGKEEENRLTIQKEEHEKIRRQRIETRVRQRAERKAQKSVKRERSQCSECGNEYVRRSRTSLCCSSVCSRKRRNRLKELNRRKAIARNGRVENSISIGKLINEQGNKCSLCGEPVDLLDFHINEQGDYIVGPKYPSVDHIRPVARGGTHTWDNVQLAHHRCNTLKSDNELYAEGNQITMAI